MKKFGIPPIGSGYAVTPGNAIIQTQLDGGRPRTRKDVLNPSSRVSVSWIFSGDQYDYFMAFYRTVTEEGALPFTIDLVIDSHAKQTYTANFVQNSVRFTEQNGAVYSVSAELDVAAAARDETADNNLVDTYNAAHGVA